MLTSKWITICMLLGALPTSAATNKYLVMKDRVNMRAKPLITSEVVGQLELDQEIVSKGHVDNEWLEIVPPEGVVMAVHKDFISGGLVTSPNLNVRAGAGINYSIVGQLKKGDSIQVVDEFGDWLRIKPPPTSAVWVHSDLVQEIKPPPRLVKVETRPPNRGAKKPPQKPRRVIQKVHSDAPPQHKQEAAEDIQAFKPRDLDLVPLKGQGEVREYEGILKTTVGFFNRKPAKHRLVRPLANGDDELICYVRGNLAQMEKFEKKPIKIAAKTFWVQGEKAPVVVPVRIVPQER